MISIHAARIAEKDSKSFRLSMYLCLIVPSLDFIIQAIQFPAVSNAIKEAAEMIRGTLTEMSNLDLYVSKGQS